MVYPIRYHFLLSTLLNTFAWLTYTSKQTTYSLLKVHLTLTGMEDLNSLNTSNRFLDNTTDPSMTDKFCTSLSGFTAIYATIATLLAMSSIIGNVLKLIIIKKYPIVRGPNNKYLLSVHLAIVHVILSVVLLTYLVEVREPLNSTFSRVREALVVTLFICNGGSLFVSALKKIFVTFQPFVYFAKKSYEHRIVSVLLAFIWIISFLTGFSSMLVNDDHQNESDIETITKWSGLSLSSKCKIVTVTVFFIFTALSVIFYIITYFQLRKRNRALNKPVNSIPPPTLVSFATEFIYIVCWVPYICMLLKLGTNPMSCCMCNFVLLIGFFDTAICWITNPLIDRKYRRAFRNLLCNVNMDY